METLTDDERDACVFVTFSSHLYVSHIYANFNFNFTSIIILILAHVTGSAQRKSKTIGTEYLMHLALIITTTGMG